MAPKSLKNVNYELYAVTDRTWLAGKSLELAVEEAILGGASIIQLREKNLSKEDFIKEALKIKQVCAKYNVPLIINDNVEVMLACAADGIHIGQGDLPLLEVRKMVGEDKIIGVSAQTLVEAEAAFSAGADYLGVGAIFPTNTKKDALDVSISTLRTICQKVTIPVVAIGGIHLDNIKELKNTNIAGIAVVSEIFAAKDIINSTKVLLEKFRENKIDVEAYDNFIFDYDGTLLDSMPAWMSIASSYVKSKGLTPDHTLDTYLAHYSSFEAAKYIHETYQLGNNPQETLADINNFFQTKYVTLPLKKGVREYLEILEKKEKKIILLSQTASKLLLPSLEKNGLNKYFNAIYSASDLGLSKKDQEIYRFILEKEALSKAKTIMFDDALYALKALNAVGITAVGVVDKYNLDDTKEILALVKYYGSVGNL